MEDLLQLLSPKSVCLFVLILTRLSGMLINAPFFSTFPIPMQAKAGLVAMIAFMTYPMVLNISNFETPTSLLVLSLMMFKELFVGILIGFCANIIFIGIQMAGQLLSIQMGLAISNVLDPVTKQQVPTIGQFYLFMAGMIFLFINGHHWLFTCVYDTYTTMPVGMDLHLTGKMVDGVIMYTSQMFTIAFGLIMPIYGVLFIVDISLGFVSKMMPQMNVFMVALPLKIYIGLSLMLLFITTTGIYLASLIKNLLQSVTSIFV